MLNTNGGNLGGITGVLAIAGAAFKRGWDLGREAAR